MVKVTSKQKKTENKTIEKKFSPKEWIAAHPYSKDVVKRIKKEIKQHIIAYCSSEELVIWSDWYVGISKDPDTDRANGHKSKKNLLSLEGYGKFFSFSLSNARQTEEECCNEFGLNHCKTIGNVTPQTKWCYIYNLTNSPRKTA